MRESTLKLTSSLVLLAFASACAQAPLANRQLASAAAAGANSQNNGGIPALPSAARAFVRTAAPRPVAAPQPGDSDFEWERPSRVSADGQPILGPDGKPVPVHGLTDYLFNQHWNNHAHEKSFLKRSAKTFAGYGPEMLRFYAAIGAMETSKCLVEKDPTICTSYWSSLTEGDEAVVGHVGFLVFMVGAGIPNAILFHKFPKLFYNMSYGGGGLPTKIFGWGIGQLGMMAGLMAQSIGSEIYFHPAWQEYKQAIKANSDPKFRAEKRNEMIAKIWSDTGGSKKWWKNQAVEGSSMISAVLAAGATTWVLDKLWLLVGEASHKTVTGWVASAALGQMVGYMFHTMLFLSYAGWFGDKFHAYFDRKNAMSELNKAQEEFEAELKRSAPQAKLTPGSADPELMAIAARAKSRMNRSKASIEAAPAPADDTDSDEVSKAPAAPAPAPAAPAAALQTAPSQSDDEAAAPAGAQGAPDLSQLAALLGGAAPGGKAEDTRTELEKKADALEMAWDNFRSTMLASTQMIQYRHSDYLGKFDEKLMKQYYSYLWIAAGAQKDDKLWKDDQIDWKKDLDIGERINDFFCGSSIESAVVDSADWHGIPIPGKFDPKVKPVRIGTDLNLCVKDLKLPGTPDDVQRARDEACKQDKRLCTAHDVWSHRLKSFNLNSHAEKTYRELLQRKALIAMDAEKLSKQVDDAFAKVMEATNPVRDKIIKRYNVSIQKELLLAMTGQKVDVKEGQPVAFDLERYKASLQSSLNSGQMSAGVLPAYESELSYWKSMLTSNPGQMKFIQTRISHIQEKEKAAEELLKYTLTKPEDRKAPPETEQDGGDAAAMMAQGSQEPYKMIVQMWKDFILK